MYADNLSLFFSFLFLHLCLRLRRPGLHVRRNDASTNKNTREGKSFHSLVLVLMLAPLRHTCKLGLRKPLPPPPHIRTSANTRRLCLRRTGLHVGLVVMLVLMPMLAS